MANASSRKVRRNGNCVCSKVGLGFVLETFTNDEDAMRRAEWLLDENRPCDANQPAPLFKDYLDRWPRGWTKAMEVK